MSLFTRIIKFPKNIIIPLNKLNRGVYRRDPYLVCLTNNEMLFHTTAYKFKRRKVGDERKVNRVLEYHKVKGDFVEVWKNMTVLDLAKALSRNVNYVKDLCTNLMEIRSPHTPITDMKILQQAIRRSGHRMRIVANPDNIVLKSLSDKDAYPRPPAPKSALKPRPPVVTVMGHVDHGKTTLLDALRHSKVVDQEFGGITQHIGAFSVVLDTGAKITFLDTPGHAAFTAMRERGAMATDIVVLVVAADDGVMEQTVESIRMAREAKVPILVAINKIDSPKADVERARDMLIQVGLQVEQRGGDIQSVPISALKKQNLNQLIEALIVQAELLEISADPTGLVEGVVIESRLDPHRGKLGTIIVQRGTLKKGDILVAGCSLGKVRGMRDSQGNFLKKVTPGNPTEIEGWKDLPSPGDLILQVDSESRAREVIKVREDKIAEARIAADMEVIKEKQEHHQLQYKERLALKRSLGRYKLKNEGPRQPEISKEVDSNPTLNLVIKSDVDGTLEAVLNTLDTYDLTNCKMDLVHYGVGPLSENDIELASTFKAIIYAFNIGCPPKIEELAKSLDVTIKYHNVIYKLVDDVKVEINNRLPQKEVEDIIGEATVLQQFDINIGRKKVPIAGCRCIKGVLRKSANYKLLRKGEVIHVGQLSAMKHLKDDIDVIKSSMECGLQLMDKTVTFEHGDTLICFQNKLVDQVTTWDPGF